MPSINLENIAKIAHLNLSSGEKVKFEKECNEILKMFEQIEEVNVEGVNPSFQPIEVKNVVREDVAVQKDSKRFILSKDIEDEFFVAPRIK